ncbi:MAG: M48 family metalloprotease [Elusimicrobia bacterium]|nr:M48 family metalloprotease [Elusimicrobiota bacterium]
MLCCACAAWAADTGQQFTKRVKNEAREGPGNYYPLVSVLPKGASVPVINVQGGWVNFKLEGSKKRSAWIAKNCLVAKGAGQSMMNLDLSGSASSASPASVAAAVRGFATRYGRAKASALDKLAKLKPPFFTPAQYREFQGPAQLPEPGASDEKLLADYEVTLQEEGIGLGIAARVAARGLNEKRSLLRYLNLLATSLAEASGAYDYPFKVYVMKSKEVNAVAVPGGAIFLAEGVISACRDEAELAAVIAHEMTHIVLRHGLKELKVRDIQLKAERAASELDAMAGDAPDEAAEELEDWAQGAYESVHKPRLQEYEEEADAGAALILSRAGYDPAALPRMIARVGEAVAAARTMETENPFSRMDYRKRAEAADAFIRRAVPASRWGMKNQERFERSATLDR